MLTHEGGETVDAILQGILLGGWDEAEVTVGDLDVFGFGNGAEHGHVAVFLDALFHDVEMTRTGDLVEDDAGDPDAGIEVHDAVDDGGDAAGDAGGIDDEHDWRLEGDGELGGAVGALPVEAVENAHGAFDDGDVLVTGVGDEGMQDLLVGHHDAVEVAARDTAGEGGPAWVDVIRSFFEALQQKTTFPQGPLEPYGERGFARAPLHSCDDESRNVDGM